jgi:hypothetical protein
MPDPTAHIDVELVPAPTAQVAPAAQKRGFGLSPRDWVMMGVGASGVVLAGVVGFVLANFLR